ncbi:type II toxin-antitoxin system PemK/MazF family toxin [Cytobacillus firmus]|nr:type II toxin-antitoxin system PemK/MazF family toxin [Cytobacillus firmus]
MTLPYNDVIKASKWLTTKFQLIKRVDRAKTRRVKRGDVYWCEFGENIGSEQCEKRPALILSNNPSNETSPNVIVAPITNTARVNPSVFQLNRPATSPLQGNVLLANIKTVSKARLGDRICALDKTTEMPGVELAMYNAVGVAGIFNKLQAQLDDKIKYLEKVKKQRNAAEDGLKEVAKALGLNEKSELPKILKMIEALQDKGSDDEIAG